MDHRVMPLGFMVYLQILQKVAFSSEIMIIFTEMKLFIRCRIRNIFSFSSIFIIDIFFWFWELVTPAI